MITDKTEEGGHMNWGPCGYYLTETKAENLITVIFASDNRDPLTIIIDLV